MEMNFRVSETVLSRSELTEILRGARHHVIEQAKDNSPSRFLFNRNIELYGETWGYRQKFSEGMQIVLLSTAVRRDEGRGIRTGEILLLKQRL
jgi:hypothetical protein